MFKDWHVGQAKKCVCSVTHAKHRRAPQLRLDLLLWSLVELWCLRRWYVDSVVAAHRFFHCREGVGTEEGRVVAVTKCPEGTGLSGSVSCDEMHSGWSSCWCSSSVWQEGLCWKWLSRSVSGIRLDWHGGKIVTPQASAAMQGSSLVLGVDRLHGHWWWLLQQNAILKLSV